MLTELAQRLDLHPNRIKPWKNQLLEGAAGVLGGEAKADAAPAVNLEDPYAKTGQLALENAFLSGSLGNPRLQHQVHHHRCRRCLAPQSDNGVNGENARHGNDLRYEPR